MKCKACGHIARSLPAMSAHYRKKHPGKMKRKTHKSRKSQGVLDGLSEKDVQKIKKLMDLLRL